MTDFLTDRCFGCGAEIAPAPGHYYCDKCVAAQLRAYEAERKAFEAFHAYADAVLHRGRA